MAKHALHLVSFDVPYPSDYGGVIDVFFKIKALHKMGVKIILHCFQYGRPSSKVLENYCDKVYYYPRKTGLNSLLSTKPYITFSRRSSLLLKRLSADAAPILFEGEHCTLYLGHPQLAHKKQYVRTHNVEYQYYRNLAAVEPSWLRSLFFRLEAWKLRKWASRLPRANHLFVISPNDQSFFGQLNEHLSLVTPFHGNEFPNEESRTSKARENFCLYHGNLAVAENEEAARFLIEEVFDSISIPLYLFGNGAKPRLRRVIEQASNVHLVEGGHAHLENLIARAKVVLLPTFQSTGMKLKLLYSLYHAECIIANSLMVASTGLEELLEIRDDAMGFQEAIKEAMRQNAPLHNVPLRRKVLKENFSDHVQAEKLYRVLFQA